MTSLNGDRRIWQEIRWHHDDGLSVIERAYQDFRPEDCGARFLGEVTVTIETKRASGVPLRHNVLVRFVIDGATSVEDAFRQYKAVADAKLPQVQRLVMDQVQKQSIVVPGKQPQLPSRLEL